MGSITALNINKAYNNNECQIFIVYGGLGIGKTSYALQVLLEVYKVNPWTSNNFDVLKDHFFFNPLEFVQALKNIKERQKCLIWDDAGVWLYYLDFHTPLLKTITKMMQLIRSKTSAIILTTPNPSLILGKLRGFPQTTTIKITKINPYEMPKKMMSENTGVSVNTFRRARAYQSSFLPDLQKLRVHTVYEDFFSIWLPSNIYKDWYVPLREKYTKEIENELYDALPDKFKVEVRDKEITIEDINE